MDFYNVEKFDHGGGQLCVFGSDDKYETYIIDRKNRIKKSKKDSDGNFRAPPLLFLRKFVGTPHNLNCVVEEYEDWMDKNVAALVKAGIKVIGVARMTRLWFCESDTSDDMEAEALVSFFGYVLKEEVKSLRIQ
jgi:hypothetical protein